MLGHDAIGSRPIGDAEQGKLVFVGPLPLKFEVSASKFGVGPYNFPGRMNERGQVLGNFIVSPYGSRLYEAYCDESGIATNDTKPTEEAFNVDGDIRFTFSPNSDVDFNPGFSEEGDVRLTLLPASEYKLEESYPGDIRLTFEVESDYESGDLGILDSVARSMVRAVRSAASAPIVKGRNPMPGQTAVERNRRVEMVISSLEDEIDIDSIKVTINGVEYDNSDPEFSAYWLSVGIFVSVGHPDFNYEQNISVMVEAWSKLMQAMNPVSYNYYTEWRPELTRFA